MAVAWRVYVPVVPIAVPAAYGAPLRVAEGVTWGSLARTSGVTARVNTAPAAIGRPLSRICTLRPTDRTVNVRM